MVPVVCRIWMRSTSKHPSEAMATSARPAVFRLTSMRCGAWLWCRSSADGDELCVKIALCRFEPVRQGRSRLVPQATPAEGSIRGNVERKLHAERSLVERDLLLAPDLVSQLFARRRDIIGAGLRVVAAGEDLGQLVFRDAVVLEDAGNARLDRTVRMVVGPELRVQIGRDVVLVVARRDPFGDVGMAGPVNLEAGRIHHGPN